MLKFELVHEVFVGLGHNSVRALPLRQLIWIAALLPGVISALASHVSPTEPLQPFTGNAVINFVEVSVALVTISLVGLIDFNSTPDSVGIA